MKHGLRFATVLLVVLGACGSGANGATAIAAQSDDSRPVRLAPPDEVGGSESEMVIQIEVGTFAEKWRTAQGVAARFGGTVTATATGVVEEDGDRFSYGAVTIEIPSDRLDSATEFLESLGTVVSSNFRSGVFSRPTSEIVATITESPSAVTRVESPGGRVAGALDTAGDILLTMVAVAIVAGAVLIPLGLVALLGLAVWHRIPRRRVVLARAGAADSDAETEERPIQV